MGFVSGKCRGVSCWFSFAVGPILIFAAAPCSALKLDQVAVWALGAGCMLSLVLDGSRPVDAQHTSLKDPSSHLQVQLAQNASKKS